MRLIVDTPSLIWYSLLHGKDEEFSTTVEHEGKNVTVNGWQYGLEQATDQLLNAMNRSGTTPSDAIFVHAGKLSTARRKAIYGQYKTGRDSRPPLAYEQFALCKEELFKKFRGVGAQHSLGHENLWSKVHGQGFRLPWRVAHGVQAFGFHAG